LACLRFTPRSPIPAIIHDHAIGHAIAISRAAIDHAVGDGVASDDKGGGE
jgi:hypothetical protein